MSGTDPPSPLGGGASGGSGSGSGSTPPRRSPGSSTLDPLIGQVLLDRYEVLRRIGSGGMGSVYVGRQRAVGRDVALKVLRTDLVNNNHVRERFRREAEIIGKLRHPNTIQLYDYGEGPDGLAVMVTELLVGSPLNDRLKEKGPIPLLGALQIGIEIAGSLAEAHLHGLVHRDLKPANIFLVDVAGQNHAKVLDFGIARILDEEATRLTSTGQVFGTPRYMSPEQALSTGEVDSRSDIYSLGLILFECIVGQPPFVAQTSMQYLSAHSTKPPPKLRSQYPEAPEALEALIDACLAKDPNDRPQTADAVAEALAAIKRSVESGAGMQPIQIQIPRGVKGATAHPQTVADASGVGIGMAARPDATLPSPARGATSGADTGLEDRTLLRPREQAKKTPVLLLSAGLFVLAGLAFAGVRIFRPADTVITSPSGGTAEAAIDAGAQGVALGRNDPADGGEARVREIALEPDAGAGAEQQDARPSAEVEDAGEHGLEADSGPLRERETGKALAGGHRQGHNKGTAKGTLKGPKGHPVVTTQEGEGAVTGPAQIVLEPGERSASVLELAKACRDSAWSGPARLNVMGCPASCAIIVDEKCAGRTPVAGAVALPPGFREVAVVCGAHVRAKARLKLVADEGSDLRCH